MSNNLQTGSYIPKDSKQHCNKGSDKIKKKRSRFELTEREGRIKNLLYHYSVTREERVQQFHRLAILLRNSE